MARACVIRPVVPADLTAALALLDVGGLAGAKANLERYLRWQPRCGTAVLDGERIVGLVTVLRQGTAGFVGAMVIHPDHRGTGLGRRLLLHAHEEVRRDGVTTLLLEATPLGEHLYRTLGYVVESETLIVVRAERDASPAVRIAAADHVAIASLDRIATGVDRADMIDALLAEGGPGATVRDAGRVDGFGLIVGDRLGPVIASSEAMGRELIDRLAPACNVATVPEPNRAACDALASHGFVEARRLRRMRLGPSIAARTSYVWALASPGAG